MALLWHAIRLSSRGGWGGIPQLRVDSKYFTAQSSCVRTPEQTGVLCCDHRRHHESSRRHQLLTIASRSRAKSSSRRGRRIGVSGGDLRRRCVPQLARAGGTNPTGNSATRHLARRSCTRVSELVPHCALRKPEIRGAGNSCLRHGLEWHWHRYSCACGRLPFGNTGMRLSNSFKRRPTFASMESPGSFHRAL